MKCLEPARQVVRKMGEMTFRSWEVNRWSVYHPVRCGSFPRAGALGTYSAVATGHLRGIRWQSSGGSATIRGMRFRIEHYRAYEAPESALGFQYAPTGRVEEIDAHDPVDAAAAALTSEEDAAGVDTPEFDPGHGLYAYPGEEEAVRVIEIS